MRGIWGVFSFWPWPQSNKNGVQFRWEVVDPLFLVNGLFEWGELHQIQRKGWPDRGAEIPDWVFGHSEFVGIWSQNLAHYLKKESGWKAWFASRVEPTRCQTLGLYHDWGESGGDRTPYEGLIPRTARSRRRFFRRLPILDDTVTEELRRQKREAEERAIVRLIKFLSPPLGIFVFRAWDEYRQQRTMEAIFTHQIHALLDCVRAVMYKQVYPKEEFISFFETARQVISDRFLLQLVDLVEGRYRLIAE